jgi:hypothetical protein
MLIVTAKVKLQSEKVEEFVDAVREMKLMFCRIPEPFSTIYTAL